MFLPGLLDLCTQLYTDAAHRPTIFIANVASWKHHIGFASTEHMAKHTGTLSRALSSSFLPLAKTFLTVPVVFLLHLWSTLKHSSLAPRPTFPRTFPLARWRSKASYLCLFYYKKQMLISSLSPRVETVYQFGWFEC